MGYLPPGDGPMYRVVGGDEVFVKVTSEQTGGACAIMETRVPPQGGPPPHVHHREDESFYILEGEFEFHMEGETIRATAGSVIFAPRDVPHRFQNVGSDVGRFIVVVTPGGFERFIAELAQLDQDAPPDFAKMGAIAARYGLEFL